MAQILCPDGRLWLHWPQMAGWIALAIIVLALIGLAFLYNRLVVRRNRTQEAWSGIDVELKRRHDLVPNLVETVRGYAAHERGTLDEVTKARAGAESAARTRDPAAMGSAEGALSQALHQLFAVVESYPDLKAVATFQQLQQQLVEAEDKIEFSRRFYNGNVRDYNTSLQTVPASLIAGILGFKPFEFFQPDAIDRAVPTVTLAPREGPVPPAQPPSPPPLA